MQTILRFIVHSLRVRRIEYRIAEIPILLIPVFLTLRDRTPLATLAFWEGVCVFFFLFSLGDLVNCLTDRELDRTYKPHLSEAVYGLGVGNVAAQAILSAVAALLLAAHAAWLLDRWVLLACAAVGVVVAPAYSVEPVRLKRRGLLQVLFFWLGLFAGPMVFAALLVDPAPPPEVYGVALAYGLLQTGVVLVNTAEDYPEDRAMGINTVIVSLGLPRGIRLAHRLALAGALALWLLFSLVLFVRAPWLGGYLAVLAFILVSGFVCDRIRRLRLRVESSEPVEAVDAVKEAGRWVPLAITLVALSALLVALARFAARPDAGSIDADITALVCYCPAPCPTRNRTSNGIEGGRLDDPEPGVAGRRRDGAGPRRRGAC